MLVVDRSSMGAEILRARTVPWGKVCLVVKLRWGMAAISVSFGLVFRLVVKARDSEVDMLAELNYSGREQ